MLDFFWKEKYNYKIPNFKPVVEKSLNRFLCLQNSNKEGGGSFLQIANALIFYLFWCKGIVFFHESKIIQLIWGHQKYSN